MSDHAPQDLSGDEGSGLARGAAPDAARPEKAPSAAPAERTPSAAVSEEVPNADDEELMRVFDDAEEGDGQGSEEEVEGISEEARAELMRASRAALTQSGLAKSNPETYRSAIEAMDKGMTVHPHTHVARRKKKPLTPFQTIELMNAMLTDFQRKARERGPVVSKANPGGYPAPEEWLLAERIIMESLLRSNHRYQQLVAHHPSACSWIMRLRRGGLLDVVSDCVRSIWELEINLRHCVNEGWVSIEKAREVTNFYKGQHFIALGPDEDVDDQDATLEVLEDDAEPGDVAGFTKGQLRAMRFNALNSLATACQRKGYKLPRLNNYRSAFGDTLFDDEEIIDVDTGRVMEKQRA